MTYFLTKTNENGSIRFRIKPTLFSRWTSWVLCCTTFSFFRKKVLKEINGDPHFIVGVFYSIDIYCCMLNEKIYQNASTEFGTPVGVANIIGYKKKTDHITEYSKESYRVLSDDLDINYIITDVIEQNKYQEFQRILYDIKQKGNTRLKQLTIYKRAYKILNGEKESNTKRRQVQI